MKLNRYPARVISLRTEISNDESFEDALRGDGHKVTVLSSTEPAFALVSSSWPDVVMFDPISPFGMSGSVQRIRSSFDGVIVAAGGIIDPTITKMLKELGISHFAANAMELLEIVRDVPSRVVNWNEVDDDLLAHENTAKAQKGSTTIVASGASGDSGERAQVSKPAEPEKVESAPVVARRVATPSAAATIAPAKTRRSLPSIKLPMKRWHKTAVGAVAIALVVVAVAIPFLRPQPVDTETVAKALPVVPTLLTKPLVPLTIAELSGEILPLEIQGIKDRAVINESAVAFWGDTAPDAFVTVNGKPIDISEYGAFVVDYPLDDGANFIEVLASDFQGRTTSKSFTIVSLQ
jgi:hypothetical protein